MIISNISKVSFGDNKGFIEAAKRLAKESTSPEVLYELQAQAQTDGGITVNDEFKREINNILDSDKVKETDKHILKKLMKFLKIEI